MIPTRLQTQIEFIAELDKLKGVLRKTSPIGLKRRENSAEHSWQVILSALLLAEHSNAKIDLLKVVKMLAIHDVVEIDVGDTFHYAKEKSENLYERELEAAQKIFGTLPSDQSEDFLALWKEFEARETSEARFAAAVDRLMAFILNSRNEGGTWVEFSLTPQEVLEKNSHVAQGSEELWNFIQEVVTDARRKGELRES